MKVSNDLIKALAYIAALLVLVGVVDPLLIWASLDVPPESMGIGLGSVYVWWAMFLAAVATVAVLVRLVAEDTPGSK